MSVFVCSFFKFIGLKIKHGKSKAKQQECKNETSNENKQGESNTKKCQPIGQFSLKLQTKSKHRNGYKTPKQTKKKSRNKISKLLQDLRRCMTIKHKDVKCEKGKKNAKKAMIWPKKMLPNLEKMLLNKINGGGNGNVPGDNNGDNGFENYDNPSDNSDENTFSPTTSSTSNFGKNDFSDNWDSVNPRHHRAKFHGMEVVPLLKMLKEKVGDTSSFDSNAFTGMPSNQGGNKYLTKLLLSQALGKPDKGAVMKDMMQEFFLANGNERSGEEAREAFSELVGHNNLVSFNSQMEAENSDVNVGGGTQGMSGSEGRQGMPERNPSYGSQSGVLQAQELPNGQIAPLNQQMGQGMISNRPAMQEMMAQAANPTTRMLNDASNVPSMPNVPNVPNVPNAINSDVQSQLAARITAEQNAQARRTPFAKSNNLIFEEQGESAARGIRPPPFQASQRAYDAERAMKLGANYQSSPIREPQRLQAPVMSSVPQRIEMAMRDGEPNVVGMRGERFGDEVAAYFPSYGQQELAARRDALPSSHKHKTTKAPMRSKDLPTPHKAKHTVKTSKKI